MKDKIKESLIHALDEKPVNFAKSVEEILETRAFSRIEELKKLIENDETLPPRDEEDDFDDEEDDFDDDLDEDDFSDEEE